MTEYAQRQPVDELLIKLHDKFRENITDLEEDHTNVLESIELSCRIIDGVRVELLQTYCGTDEAKIKCAELLNEIFSDFAVAMYLLSTGLITPARMLIRRALEIGIATVYLWDLPNELWGWLELDEDLSFQKMVAHLNSPNYLAHMSHLQKTQVIRICDHARLQEFYRRLSNTIHGKSDALPPLNPDRYSSQKNDIKTHFALLLEIQKSLISLWCNRFINLRANLEKNFPI